MEERVSGFRVRGSWDDVVAQGERFARVLWESGVDEGALAEWDNWRPKAYEELEEEVSEETVEKASIEEGAGERIGKEARKDLERASERTLESIEKAEGDGPRTFSRSGRKPLATRFARLTRPPEGPSE